MGGIVAAEALLMLANEQPIPASAAQADINAPKESSNVATNSSSDKPQTAPEPDLPATELMFPHVQGMLAFDTPYLGLAPEMIAHGLEGGHKFASSAYNTYNEVASIFGWGGSMDASTTATAASKAPVGALPPAPTASTVDAAAAPKWSSWGKYAMFAGAAGAVAAGGAAALYSQREKLSAGWAWAGSHLLFVGDLAKAERLRQRVDKVNRLCTVRGIGAANMYTNLGRGAREGYGLTETLSGRDRTFCNLPPAVKENRDGSKQGKSGLKWVKAINEKAKDETSAHMSMFYPKDNPGFYSLGEEAKEMITLWVDDSWYASSTGKSKDERLHDTMNPSSIGKDWEGVDDTTMNDDEGLHMSEENTEDATVLEGSILIDRSPANSTTLKQTAATDGKVPLPVAHNQGL